MLRAGKMDRTVWIVRRGPGIDDGYSKKPGAWQLLCRRSASIKPSRRGEQLESVGVSARGEVSIWIHSDSVTRTIVATDAVVIEGQVYELTAAPIEIGRREGVELLAVRADPADMIEASVLAPA